MTKEYFQVTTLYAFGRALAVERILALEGIYFQIESYYKQLNQVLQAERLDYKLTGLGFHFYNRLSLAEAAIKQGELPRATTFLEFRQRYETEIALKTWLAPANEAIEAILNHRGDILL